MQMQKLIATGVSILLLILFIFLPRLLSLSAHWASDEDLWMQRSRDFFFALQTKQFTDTYITHHPGVTTCWLGSFPIGNTYSHNPSFKRWFYSEAFLSPTILERIRFPIAAVTGLLILGAGILMYHLFGRITSGLGALFLGVEPFLLAESRRVHTDALTSLFLFLSLLLWICYLEGKTLRRRYLIFSGLCFGLACLSKSLAGAFLFFLPLLFGWYIKQCGMSWMKLLWSMLLWLMASLLTVLVAWPYLWTVKFGDFPISPFFLFAVVVLLTWSNRKLSTDLSTTLTQTELCILGSGFLVIVVPSLFIANTIVMEMYWALTRPHSLPTLFLGDIRYNPGPLFFPMMWFVWSTPLTLPLIGFAMCRTWQQRHTAKKTFRVVVMLAFFVLFYLVGLSLTAKKISRYIVIFLPVVSLLTALGAIQVVQILKKKHWQCLCLILIVMLQVVPVLRLHPYYRTYYNPLLPGEWVAKNTGSITGAGLDLAADYLNTLPNARHLRVRVTWFSKDLAHYFVGNTSMRRLSSDTLRNFDYDVEYLYDRQIQRTFIDVPPITGMPFTKSQKNKKIVRELEHIVRLNGIDYVWIYRVLEKSRGEE